VRLWLAEEKMPPLTPRARQIVNLVVNGVPLGTRDDDAEIGALAKQLGMAPARLETALGNLEEQGWLMIKSSFAYPTVEVLRSGSGPRRAGGPSDPAKFEMNNSHPRASTMRTFTATTTGPDRMGLRELLHRYADEKWVAAHMTPEQAAASVLDCFKRAVRQEMGLLEVGCRVIGE
jgi:hypothetical protein